MSDKSAGSPRQDRIGAQLNRLMAKHRAETERDMRSHRKRQLKIECYLNRIAAAQLETGRMLKNLISSRGTGRKSV
jgi:hypothetical protein